MSKIRGLFRDGPDDPQTTWAHVTDGTKGFNLPEPLYREQGCEPPFEALPTKAQFTEAMRLGVGQIGLPMQPPIMENKTHH